MAAVFHISEEDAARDFAAVMRRVRAGEEIVVAGANGVNARIAPEAIPAQGIRTLADTLAILRRIKETDGLARVDDEFAADIVNIRGEFNECFGRALDGSKWD